MPSSLDAVFAADPDRPLAGPQDDGDLGLVLKPIIAGARARGVADGFEMLGLGAVLIDATGRVLHAGGRARRLMGGRARIVGDHLVAERSRDNAAVERLVGSVIGTGHYDPEARIALGAAREGAPRLSLRAIRFDSDEGEAQRLRAVLVLEESHAS